MFGGLSRIPITTILVGGALGLSVLVYLQVIDIFELYFNKALITKEREYWRPFTSILCYGSISMDVLYDIYMLYNYSEDIEVSLFSTRPADFLLFLLFGFVCMWGYAWLYPVTFLGKSLTSYLIYYASKMRAGDRAVLLFLPFSVPSSYIPLINLAGTLLSRNKERILSQVVGYAAAHIFFFCYNVVCVKWNVRIFHLPDKANRFLEELL